MFALYVRNVGLGMTSISTHRLGRATPGDPLEQLCIASDPQFYIIAYWHKHNLELLVFAS